MITVYRTMYKNLECVVNLNIVAVTIKYRNIEYSDVNE